MRSLRLALAAALIILPLAISTCAQIPKNNLKATRPAERVGNPEVKEMQSDPAFQSILANDRVRIFKVGLESLHSTAVDAHPHDYIVLSLGKSNFEVQGEGNRFPLPMDDGEMQVLKGGWPHKIASLTQTPLSLLELEVLSDVHPEHPICGLGGKQCIDGTFGSSDEGTYSQSTLFETDTVKVVRVDLGPGGILPQHHHSHCHVLLALTDLQLRDDSTPQPSKERHLQTGEALWYAEGIDHQLKNLTKQDARLVTVEFK